MNPDVIPLGTFHEDFDHMSAFACVAIWFAMPAVVFPLVYLANMTFLRIVLAGKARPDNEVPLQADWRSLLATGGIIGLSSCVGPTFGNTNENWHYSPIDAQFAPFPIFWLWGAAAIGGLVGTAIILWLRPISKDELESQNNVG